MRGLILGAVMLLAGAPGAQAQRPGGSGRQAGLFAGIILSETQQKQVDSIRTAHEPVREAMRASRQPGRGRDSAHVQLRTAMQEQMRQSYRAVLTPAQQAVFDSNLARMPRGGPGQGPRRRGRGDAPCGAARASDQSTGGR
jgi:Spy/CpxP family protein refolding chaperone